MMRTQSAQSGSTGVMVVKQSGKGRILVVDDDRLVLATLTHGLAQAGFDIIDADNGDDAILLARQQQPELALLDIRMEGKSGFDVAAYLREALHIPFMFLSAFSDEATTAQVKALGAVNYLVKPLDIGQIVPAVEAALAQLPHRGAQPQKSAASRLNAGAPGLPGLQGMDMGLPPRSLDTVALAVGVLMHRYSLPRADALARLQRLAHDEGRMLSAQAERLLDAVELLAKSGPGGASSLN